MKRKKIKIVLLESQDYPEKAFRILSSFAEVFIAKGDPLKTKAIRDCHCIVTRLRYYISEELMKLAPELRAIATATTGLNHIDLSAAQRLGIVIISLKGETAFLKNIPATAEHTIGLILSVLRKTPFAHRAVLNNQWNRDFYKGEDLKDKTVGIIGYGRIGKMVARYLSPFTKYILYYDPHVETRGRLAKKTTLSQLLRRSDIITIHMAYSEGTRKFINREFFAKMKKGVYFINTARGELVDENALVEAIVSGKIKGAALDVLDNEQSQKIILKNPLVRLAKRRQNLIITPHLGGATYDSMCRAEIFIAKKLQQFFNRLEK